MAVSVRVGKVNAPAGAGNQAISGVGIAPTLIFFLGSSNTADGSAVNVSIAFGFAEGVSSTIGSRFISIFSADNVATTDVGIATTASYRLMGTNGTTIVEFTVASMDADGFTLNWTTTVSSTDVHFLAIGGTTDTAFDYDAIQTTTDVFVNGDLGIFPALLVLVNTTINTSGSGGSSGVLDGSFAISVFDGRTQATAAMGVDDLQSAASGIAAGYANTGRAIPLFDSFTGILDGEATILEVNPLGYAGQMTNPTGSNYRVGVLAASGLVCKVGSLTVPSGTGNQSVTGVGFTPLALMFFGSHKAIASTPAITRGAFFVGFARTTSERGVVCVDQTANQNPTVADHNNDSTKCIKAITAGTPTVDYAADLVSLDADGFTINWSTLAAGAGDAVFYVAFGAVASSAGPPSLDAVGLEAVVQKAGFDRVTVKEVA